MKESYYGPIEPLHCIVASVEIFLWLLGQRTVGRRFHMVRRGQRDKSTLERVGQGH